MKRINNVVSFCSVGVYRVTNYIFRNMCFPGHVPLLRVSMGSRSRSDNHLIWHSYVLHLHLLGEET